MQNAPKPATSGENLQVSARKITLKRTSKKTVVRAAERLEADYRTQTQQQYGLDPNKLYTGKFVCEFMGISVDCFRDLCHAGVIRHHVVAGRLWRVQGCEIIRYLQNCLK